LPGMAIAVSKWGYGRQTAPPCLQGCRASRCSA